MNKFYDFYSDDLKEMFEKNPRTMIDEAEIDAVIDLFLKNKENGQFEYDKKRVLKEKEHKFHYKAQIEKLSWQDDLYRVAVFNRPNKKRPEPVKTFYISGDGSTFSYTFGDYIWRLSGEGLPLPKREIVVNELRKTCFSEVGFAILIWNAFSKDDNKIYFNDVRGSSASNEEMKN